MRALVVLYYWPPSGGPGVQRGVKLCRHLRDEGVEPVVITVRPDAYALPGEYDPDPTLAADVPSGLRVVRTPHGFRGGARRLLGRLRLIRAVQHADPGSWFERQAGWRAPLTEALLREVESSRPDVILSSSQPYVAHLAARDVRRATGVPWVADFRDPWTLSWGRSWASQRAFDWEERREEEVLADADVVVANTPGTRREWLDRRPWLDARKVVVVRNGYDEDDFRVAPAPRKSPSEFRIVHSGSFRAKPPGRRRDGVRALVSRPGPEPVPYDESTHSPEPLLRAMAALASRPAVRLRLVGSVDPGWLALARELGVEDRIDVLGYRPHREAVAEVLAADLLWLPTITRRDGGRVSNVPAKTYEYLGSGRPVLAYAGPGDVADLIDGRARCLRATPGPCGSDEVAAHVDAAVGGAVSAVDPDPEDARAFRRRETARGIAAALRAASRLDLGREGPETPQLRPEPVTA